jgi:hypothetical protein
MKIKVLLAGKRTHLYAGKDRVEECFLLAASPPGKHPSRVQESGTNVVISKQIGVCKEAF